MPRSREIHSIEESDIVYNINDKGWQLRGWSRAGFKTGFALHPFKILFDCGIYTSHKPEFIFQTHQHTDHIQCIAHICSRHKRGTPTVYLPAQSAKYVINYERAITELAHPDLEGMSDADVLAHQNMRIVPTNAGDVIDLSVGMPLRVEVLRAYHDVQCNGYGFSTWRTKEIRPEFAHLLRGTSSETKEEKQARIAEIKRLKAANIDMYSHTLHPEFAFFCDSTISNLTAETAWKKYPVIVCECTGLDASELSVNRDLDANHTSLQTLKPVMLEHRDKRWFLIHVSMSCSVERIQAIERELVSEGLDVRICY